MWPLSPQAQLRLGQAHSISVRATAYTAALGVVSNLPISGGAVTADATSQQRRSATVAIANPALWPANPFAMLSPLGSELAIDYGIVLLDGSTEWVPLIRGPITDVARQRPVSDSDGALQVTVADRSYTVAERRFDQPTQTIVGATAVSEIRRLITEALPGAVVTDLTGSTQVAAQLDIERERWADGVEKLADSIGAEVFANPVGAFIIRFQPTLPGVPAWIANTGDGGVLVSLDERQTREFAYSRVVASGQRTDGTPPVWAAVSDTDPTSPTYVNGPFGVKTRFYSSQLLTTTPQCTTTAAALLERTRGMAGGVSLTTVVNPALDVGDVLSIRDEVADTSHIIDSVTIPLTAGDPQFILTRSTQLPLESS